MNMHNQIMISWQGEEVEHLNSTLASLRQQLMQTVEDYERARMSLEAKHKARTFCATPCHVHIIGIYMCLHLHVCTSCLSLLKET